MMSLYDQLAQSLGSRGALGMLQDAIGSRAGALGGQLSSALGGGQVAQTLGAGVSNRLESAASHLVNKHVPPEMAQAIGLGSGVASDLMRGDWDAAGMRLINAGLLDKALGNISGLAAQTRHRGCRTPVVGGLSVQQAQQVLDAAHGKQYARQNLFLVEVSSALAGDFSQTFNVFCHGLEYAPVTLSGDKIVIGSAAIDNLKTSDPVELNIRCHDDTQGTVRRWFQRHAEVAAPSDGTVGLPGKYAIRFKVLQAFINRDTNQGGYEDKGLFRPANLQIALSRDDDALAELQMTFTQLDTFMP